jgi:uncharacterized membrane protein YhhN
MELFKKYGFILFWAIAAMIMAVQFSEKYVYEDYLRPLLMPLLALTVFSKISRKRHSGAKALIVLIFICALIGDIFFIQVDATGKFFTPAIYAFSAMNLFYAFYFIKVKSFEVKFALRTIIVAIVAGGIAFSIIRFLSQYIGEYRIPAGIYAATLIFMIIAAVNTINYKLSLTLGIEAFIPGSALFLVFFAILFLNRFFFEESFLYIAATTTYCAAHFYIAQGFARHLKSSRK